MAATVIPDRGGSVVCDLQPTADATAIDLEAIAPTAVATLGDRLHVVTGDAAGGRAVHLSVDTEAHPGPITHLPLEQAYGMTAVRDGLVVTGSIEGRPVVVGLDASGKVGWSVDVEAGGVLASWPRPVTQSNDAVRLVWSLERSGEGTRLVVADLTPGRTVVVHSIDRDDATLALEPAAGRRTTVIARAHGAPSGAELIAFGDHAEDPQEVSGAAYPVSFSWAVRENEYLLLWVSSYDRSANLARFDAGLHLIGPIHRVIGTPPPERLRAAQLVDSRDGCLAIRWQTAEEGAEPGPIEDAGRSAPRHTVRITDAVAACDPLTGRLGTVSQLPDPGLWTFSSGWVGDALVVLHGSTTPLVSVYRRSNP